MVAMMRETSRLLKTFDGRPPRSFALLCNPSDVFVRSAARCAQLMAES
jgi:hypothetical protein